MRQMTHILCTISFCLTATCSYGQQRSNFSLASLDPILINPAVVGLTDKNEYQSSYRQQWIGVEDGPQELMITGNFRYRNKAIRNIRKDNTRLPEKDFITLEKREIRRISIKHGIGGQLYSEQFGPVTAHYVSGIYATHFPIAKMFKLSFGIKGGIGFRIYDASKGSVHDAADPIFQEFVGGNRTRVNPDVDFSMRLTHKRFYVGYTAAQLTKGNVYFGDQPLPIELKLHHYFIGGGTFIFAEHHMIEPMVLVKKVSVIPTAIDWALRYNYRNLFWAAAGMRNGSAIATTAGGAIRTGRKKTMLVSYTFERQAGQIVAAGATTHEIRLGYILQ